MSSSTSPFPPIADYAFLSWAWDYFDRDHAALLESSSTPKRIAWDDATADRPTIVVD